MAQGDQGESTPRLFVPVGTLFLLAALLAVFLVEWRLAPAPEASALNFSPATLARFGAIVPMYIDAGQWWRFLTAPLLHQGFAAIADNGAFLLLAAFVERRIGWRWYLLTFAVSASLGAAASYLRLPPTAVATGASGGILGLYAAGLIRSLFASDGIRKGLAFVCALVLALGFLRGGGDPVFSVDIVAHVAGMVAGAAMGLLIVAHWSAEAAMPKRATAVLIALGAYVAMTIASFAIDAFGIGRGAPASSLAATKVPFSPPIATPPTQPPPPITAAPQPAAPRTSIPVGLRILEEQGGERVYTVPVRFGSTIVESVLDTEDPVTQILPGRLIDAEFSPTQITHSMIYGSGSGYASRLVRGRVVIGPLAGTVDIGVVAQAACTPSMPKCAIVDDPVARANFGFGSVPASLGIAATSNPLFPSLLIQLGVRRILFIAPRQEEKVGSEPGQLILNPSEDEIRGFVSLLPDPTPKAPSSTHGCLRNLTNNITFCGAIIFDSDFSGIQIFQQMDLPKRRDWSTGDKVKLMFTDSRNAREIAGVDFTIGLATLPVVRFGKPGLYADPVIRIGQVPYLGLEVLTDLVTGQVSVAARKTPDADAVGHVP